MAGGCSARPWELERHAPDAAAEHHSLGTARTTRPLASAYWPRLIRSRAGHDEAVPALLAEPAPCGVMTCSLTAPVTVMLRVGVSGC
jgi:hypothetical protein